MLQLTRIQMGIWRLRLHERDGLPALDAHPAKVRRHLLDGVPLAPLDRGDGREELRFLRRRGVPADVLKEVCGGSQPFGTPSQGLFWRRLLLHIPVRILYPSAFRRVLFFWFGVVVEGALAELCM